MCTASCLWFSSEGTLNEFLSKPGHAQWADRLIRVPGLLHNGEATTLYGVLVGISGEINRASAGDAGKVNARLPNAVLHLQPTAGFNTGLLVVFASTINRMGITKGKEVLLDYGDDYTFPVISPVAEATPLPVVAVDPTPTANPGSSEGGQPPAEKTQLPDAVTGTAWLEGTSVKMENAFRNGDVMLVSKGGSILSSQSFKAQASVEQLAAHSCDPHLQRAPVGAPSRRGGQGA